eukprot:COSAG02_NODE_436_length_22362_cov_13.985761_7_plen_32_part_00
MRATKPSGMRHKKPEEVTESSCTDECSQLPQ